MPMPSQIDVSWGSREGNEHDSARCPDGSRRHVAFPTMAPIRRPSRRSVINGLWSPILLARRMCLSSENHTFSDS